MTFIRVPRISTARQWISARWNHQAIRHPTAHRSSHAQATVEIDSLFTEIDFSLLRKTGFEELSSADVAENLNRPNSLHEEVCCVFWEIHTYVPTSWVTKKRTAVLHSSAEAEFMSSEAGLRMEGIRALGSWDTVTDVLEPLPRPDANTKTQT